MLNIIGKKNWYFLISLLVIIPGLISVMVWGLRLSIDFTGGSRITYMFQKPVDDKTVGIITNAYKQEKIDVPTVQKSGTTVIFRTSSINEKQNAQVINRFQKSVGSFKMEEFETVGPTIGQEVTANALKALLVASLLIVLYIAYAFRKVPKPTSSWRFGITAIIALLHDVLVLVGLFSIFGHFFGVEVDSLFLTALLTVMGFSVHDTIVVFDRIRENLLKIGGVSFQQIVNDSILQTMVRSLNTSLTALLVLFALLLFGGESTRWFVIALLIGITSGTYSSIFNAAPLLVVWHELDEKRKAKKAAATSSKTLAYSLRK